MSQPYYQDDHVTLYHGDALEVLPSLGDLDLSLFVTDPPFGISDAPIEGQWRIGKRVGSVSTWHAKSTWDHSLPAFDQLFPPAATVAMFGHWRKRLEVEALMPTPLRTEIIWAKDTHVGPPCPVARRDERIWVFSPDGITPTRFETSVWDSPIIPTWAHRRHKNEKPLSLMIRLVSWLTDSATIVDPFAGSGTTLRAAKDLGLSAIGIEQLEQHCETAANRLAQEVLPL
jgi:DNA modification methylase